MGDTNRTRVSYVTEVTQGTTPTTPAMKAVRMTGESLNANIQNVVSEEIRADRMVPDLVQVFGNNQGDINFEFSYPVEGTWLGEMLESALFSTWVLSNSRSNAITPGSVVSVVASTGTVTVTTGTGFLVGDLCTLAGFANAQNNGTFILTGGSATTAIVGPGVLVDEAAPPATASIKKAGARGAAGDIVAAAGGLTSTLFDFTGHGLKVGGWVKIGGSATAMQFNTAACNSFARVISIAPHALGLDNLPTGWAPDAGAGKTIDLYVPDTLTNGVTMKSFSIEKGFMDMATPSYLVYTGAVVNQLELTLTAQRIITGRCVIQGMVHQAGTVSLGVPAAATVENVLSASANVGRISEGGAEVTGPNYTHNMTIAINNNMRERPAIGHLYSIGLGAGREDLTGQMETYFGSLALYQKYVNAQATSVAVRTQYGSRAVVFSMGSIKFETGRVIAQRANQDVMATMTYRSKLDPATTSQLIISKFDYAPPPPATVTLMVDAPAPEAGTPREAVPTGQAA